MISAMLLVTGLAVARIFISPLPSTGFIPIVYKRKTSLLILRPIHSCIGCQMSDTFTTPVRRCALLITCVQEPVGNVITITSFCACGLHQLAMSSGNFLLWLDSKYPPLSSTLVQLYSIETRLRPTTVPPLPSRTLKYQTIKISTNLTPE